MFVWENIFPFLKDKFMECRILSLSLPFFFLNDLNNSFHFFCLHFSEKSNVILISVLLRVRCIFPLVSFRKFCLFLFSIIWMPSVDFLWGSQACLSVYYIYLVWYFSWICDLMSDIDLGEILSIIILNIYFLPFSLSCSESIIMLMLHLL